MTHLASVLIATDAADLGGGLLERLDRSGYSGRRVAQGAEAIAAARREHPDILLVGPTLADMEPLALVEAIKKDEACVNIPVVMVGDGCPSEAVVRAYQAGADDVLNDSFDMVAMLPRVRPLLRISTMHAELRQRAVVARDFGIRARSAVAPDGDGAAPQVLLIGREAEELRGLLGGVASFTATDSLYEAEDLLTEKNFDAAVAVTGERVDELLAFCGQVRNNPRLFNLPVLLVDSGKVGLEIGEAYRRGASRVLRSPVDPALLRCAMLSLVHRQQLRWSIRRALMETLGPSTKDPLTGAYNREFLVHYLRSRVALAQSERRHLSLLMFHVPQVDSVRANFGDEAADHLLLQLSQWIGGLLRGEDLTARYEGTQFCVVLPDTPIEEAEVVMHRIAGVVSYTDFAVKDVYQVVKVWVESGSAAVAAGDTAETLIAKARAKVE